MRNADVPAWRQSRAADQRHFTWTDVTTFVRQRDDITITGGSQAEDDSPQPAQLTLTFDNRDGRFSPLYPSGAYYPWLQRNTQIRISLTATSSSGNFYSGYRFWGEIPVWPPLNDISGSDVYVQATASGPLRRINTGGGQGSALGRYYASLTGQYAPVAYWPCEEDPGTNEVQPGVEGGQPMTITTTAKPTWKAVSKFNGSAPIGVLNGSTWDGLTGSYGSSGDDVFSTPGSYMWTATTTSVDCRVWAPGGGGESGRAITAGAGYGGNAGGGGEIAEEATLAVTPGRSYPVVIQPGGAGGHVTHADNPGSDGVTQMFTGDAVTVTAHGGKGGTSAGAGAGGTGSANTTHRGGGAGGTGSAVLYGPYRGGGGGGGGGSAGTAAAGNAGSNAPTSSLLGGAGAAAVTGGGAGGHGGANPDDAGNTAGAAPGGGGGGGGVDTTASTGHSGTQGGPGRTEFIYTPASAPPANVIRFICYVPTHGGNNSKVLVRALTGSTLLHRLDVVYGTGGVLALHGFDGSGTLTLDSGNQSWGIDGKTIMVSVELFNYGANIYWALTAVVAGASTVLGYVYGTTAGAGTVGNVSEVLAGPNADITKTAMGHISVQYAYIPLIKVSRALDGHHTEMAADRFTRLANEQALGASVIWNEAADHWGFENGTVQSWTGTNGAVTNSTVTAAGWPPEGSHSLLLTAAGGTGQWYASGPSGTSGQPVQPGDQVSAAADVYCPAALGAVAVNIDWSNAAGTYLSTTAGALTAFAAGATGTVMCTTPSAGAPASAAFFNVTVLDVETKTAGTLLYIDNVRVHPQMGPQARKRLADFLAEIKALDQGILREEKSLWGIGYRTRISLINQSPAVTLDYSQGHISPPLAPVVDDRLTRNHITVKRRKGSSVTVTLASGQMSVQEPPAGVGRMKSVAEYAAADDEQLAALAAHLLNLGTVTDERYPTITVNLARASLAGNPVATIMSAVAGVEVGDLVRLVSLPFFYPSATTDQLVVGYSEVINSRSWMITWNCVPGSPWTISVTSSLRRW